MCTKKGYFDPFFLKLRLTRSLKGYTLRLMRAQMPQITSHVVTMDLGVPQITSHVVTPNLVKYLKLGGLDLTVI